MTGEWFVSVEVGFEVSSEQQLVCLEEWCPWTEGPSDLADQLVVDLVGFAALAAAAWWWAWVVEVGSLTGWQI